MSDAGDIVEAATRAAEPVGLGDDRRYSVVVPADGRLVIIDPPKDSALPNPRRATGASQVLNVEGMVALWTKNASAASEMFANPEDLVISAVFNADEGAGGLAGHRDHRALLTLRTTAAWEAWMGVNGQLLDQTVFAEFLEDRIVDVQEPSGATMLELAQTFEQTSRVDFKSAVAPTSGVRQLVYEETATAKAGHAGQIEIPTTFVVALQPFEASAAYRVTARFRYRITNGVLKIGFRLDRPEDVLREAFNDVAESVSQGCDTVVLLGSPPPPRS